MAKNNKQEPENRKSKSALSRFRVYYEADRKELRPSSSFGKRELLIVYLTKTVHRTVVGFFVDIYLALKEIIRRVM
tara:strand:- start:7867 stop:8094 length:228 start_codon:yes stop_codon:yes gene_type:complete